MSSYSAPAAPRRTLVWIGIACWLVGLALTAFFVVRIVASAPATPQPAEGTVTLTEKGLTIWSSIPVEGEPCGVQDAQGNDVPLVDPRGTEQITVNGDSWYVVARSAEPVPAGDYAVECTDEVDGAEYGVGPRTTVTSFVLSIFGAIGSFLVFGAIGAILFTIGMVRSRRAPVGRVPGYTPPPGSPAPPVNQSFPAPPPYVPGPNPDRPQDR
ncbi:hypothetical protein HPO96_31755 [Kribbella sandramycini]|uniref:Uncharacterized protein n=1 Tax=Kribbella sandramycini TaxID=60450 RepID=A0A7Y4L7Z8_9ACTN|nr:hypothetical protein [Kribbella sandramycini]MBB6567119.1 hypothetical protein [Kribbella sandramycini]NOL44836.1 hypothetical protein [Kribbella sandramycini]